MYFGNYPKVKYFIGKWVPPLHREVGAVPARGGTRGEDETDEYL